MSQITYEVTIDIDDDEIAIPTTNEIERWVTAAMEKDGTWHGIEINVEAQQS